MNGPCSQVVVDMLGTLTRRVSMFVVLSPNADMDPCFKIHLNALEKESIYGLATPLDSTRLKKCSSKKKIKWQ